MSSADAICKHFNFQGVIGYEAFPLASGINKTQQVWPGNLTCSGMEKSFLGCNQTFAWVVQPCKSSPTSTLMCRGERPSLAESGKRKVEMAHNLDNYKNEPSVENSAIGNF